MLMNDEPHDGQALERIKMMRNYREWTYKSKLPRDREEELAEFMPAGPWDAEPDKVQWIDEETGLDCLIVRNRLGALCGYVGVGPDHPYHGIEYNECMQGCSTTTFGETLPSIPGMESVPMPDSLAEKEFYPCYGHAPESNLDVHGGITFSGFCQPGDEEDVERICHIPEPGRPDNVFWFGFDCAHAYDLAPGMVALDRKLGLDKKYPTAHDEDVYRDIEYVKGEITQLAKQLASIAA